MNAVSRLRVCAMLEGGSLLVLVLVAVPLKYGAGMIGLARVMGSVHGLFFVVFVVALFRASLEMRWRLTKTLAFLALSVVPFGVVPLERQLRGELSLPG